EVALEAARAGATRTEPKVRPLRDVAREYLDAALAPIAERIEQFYDHVLAFDTAPDLEQRLDQALSLLVELAEAELAYLVIRASSRYYERAHHACGALLDGIRALVAQPVLARAIDERVSTASDVAFAAPLSGSNA